MYVVKPERSLSVVRDEMQQRQAHIDALLAEMHHHALIVADQTDMGRVDAESIAEYRAARGRWERAIRDMDDARMKARTENAVTFPRSIGQPLGAIQGGAS